VAASRPAEFEGGTELPRGQARSAHAVPGVVGGGRAAQEVGPTAAPAPDLADMLGQAMARRAAEVCAAGGHHLSLLGPPGAGKTMLAERIPTILPRLDTAAALEVTAIHSVAGTWTVPGCSTRFLRAAGPGPRRSRPRPEWTSIRCCAASGCWPGAGSSSAAIAAGACAGREGNPGRPAQAHVQGSSLQSGAVTMERRLSWRNPGRNTGLPVCISRIPALRPSVEIKR
jgi:Magnesium chelatase, subunit ChlI